MVIRSQAEPLEVPDFFDIPEPRMVALVCSGRAGTKILQSYLDSHESIQMIPGYPLLYLYPPLGRVGSTILGKPGVGAGH